MGNQAEDLCECAVAKVDPSRAENVGMAVENYLFPAIDMREK